MRRLKKHVRSFVVDYSKQMPQDLVDKALAPAAKAIAEKIDQLILDSVQRQMTIRAEQKARDKIILSKPGLKMFKFTIGPYESLKEKWGSAFLHLFVMAKSKAEAIRLKKASDKKCVGSIRARRHKWFCIPFEAGEVVLA